jgi:hypothetical protein
MSRQLARVARKSLFAALHPLGHLALDPKNFVSSIFADCRTRWRKFPIRDPIEQRGVSDAHAFQDLLALEEARRRSLALECCFYGVGDELAELLDVDNSDWFLHFTSVNSWKKERPNTKNK